MGSRSRNPRSRRRSADGAPFLSGRTFHGPGTTVAREFKLPDIGEGVHEGEIVKWLVTEGAPIKENDLMVEVMTDKVTVQIPSPVTGKVLKLLAKEGETVKVGTGIVLLGESGETAPAQVPAPPPATSHAAPPAPPAPRMAQTLSAAPAPSAPSSGGPALAAPAVRKLARELGVNLDLVRGTGPGGRGTEDDVRGAGQGPTPAMAPRPAVAVEELPSKRAPAPAGLEERIPITGLRKRIAGSMATSN